MRDVMLYLGILVLIALKDVDGLKTPSFISSWSYMQANTYRRVNITHNINSLPVKVEVQVKTTSGPNKDFIFPGTSSAQNDDDRPELRGGVIYIYNENEVILFSGTGENARLIYTGSSFNRIGPNVQSSMSGLVRARVWSACDFPKPDFSSEWFDIAARKTLNPIFKEINHNLGVHPAYLLVQVQILEGYFAGYYFDATGTCMVDSTEDLYLHLAGVLFAYNKMTVRMWMPYIRGGFVFGLLDGWGPYTPANYSITRSLQGKARILAWRSIGKTVMETKKPYGDGASNEDYDIPINREDITNEIVVSVEVQAKDGFNTDFRFPGTGAAMEDPSNGGNYGGIIYSFNQTSVRIWRPNDTNNAGFIAFVGGFWGKVYPQASNTADVVFKVWELQVQDQGPCASDACVLTISGCRCSCCAPSPDMCSDPFTETKMNLKVLDQRPHDSMSIQRYTMSSLLQCSNMCLYNNDCALMSFNNELCILYKQEAFGLAFISDPGVQVWGKINNN